MAKLFQSGGGGSGVPEYTEYTLLGTYFDEPIGPVIDLSVYSSVVFDVEIILGTTIFANGQIAIQNVNGTGRILTSGLITTGSTGVSYILDQTGTNVQILVTCTPANGDGTIKLRRWDVPA